MRRFNPKKESWDHFVETETRRVQEREQQKAANRAAHAAATELRRKQKQLERAARRAKHAADQVLYHAQRAAEIAADRDRRIQSFREDRVA